MFADGIRRLRRGVAGASGFLKTVSSAAAFDDLTLLARGFFAGALLLLTSAARFLVVELEGSGAVAILALATRVERRRDIVLERSTSMQWKEL